jgi:hypothetical protein
MLIGVAAAVVVLALPNPAGAPGLGYVPPPKWHDTVIGFGFGVTCVGALVLVFTQVKHWEPRG